MSSREELDKFAQEVSDRPYLEYEEESEEELEELFTQKELREIKGIGFFNKIKKYFRDKRQAKTINEVDDLIEHINDANVMDVIPEKYKEMMVSANEPKDK